MCALHTRGENIFWFVYKINSENFGGLTPKPSLHQHWHRHMVTIYPFKLSQYYTLTDSHNVALKCHEVAKILHATMWQKIITTCS